MDTKEEPLHPVALQPLHRLLSHALELKLRVPPAAVTAAAGGNGTARPPPGRPAAGMGGEGSWHEAGTTLRDRIPPLHN